MRRLSLLLLLCGLASPALACGEAASRMVAEKPQELEVFARLDPISVSKPFGLELILCGNTSATAIEADAWMPAHKHGMNYTPEINALGDGRYAVSNMVFHMPGKWQVRVLLQAPDQQPTTYLLDVDVK